MTSGTVAGVRLEALTRPRAEELADELLEMTADSGWDDWTRENLLSERPGKWDVSLLATSGGRPVAWAVASRTSDSLHLHHIVVAPHHRSAGVGARMVGELLRLATPGRMTLKVHTDNTAAARFYERLGFREGATTPSGYRCYALETGQHHDTGAVMKVAVHQPNYAPWCGYFAKLFQCEAFVFFDDVQLPQGRSYVSRTKVAKGKDGDQWLTVPVNKSGSPRIDEVRFAEGSWSAKHLSTLHHTYAKAAHVRELLELVTPVYEGAGESLASFNMAMIETVARYLGWAGTFHRSSDHPEHLKADERIARLVSDLGGDVYVSGAGGENYQSEETYAAKGVRLEVRPYTPLEYERSGWPFVPGLSCFDALAHLGRDARTVMSYSGATD